MDLLKSLKVNEKEINWLISTPFWGSLDIHIYPNPSPERKSLVVAVYTHFGAGKIEVPNKKIKPVIEAINKWISS
ncbi:hypothetical protein J7K70_01875 [bacterium]|nr:hypothetical protein [bacterium]